MGEDCAVTLRLDPALGPVKADPGQLEQVLLNLALNSRDAMPRGGALSVETSSTELGQGSAGVGHGIAVRPGRYVLLAVSDTGHGMDRATLAHVFEPFFTTKPVGKGTGLGLSQIFGFAHQSGGEVGIESELGRGTTVSLYLPRSESAAAAVRLHPAVQRSEGEAHVPGARILLVEDDPRVRTATVGALEDLGYEPIACSGGHEALALFDSMEFDLVISDVIMPEMTGPELIRIIKAKRPDVAVLFVTGYVGEGEGDDLVGYELLRKPFTVSALATSVAAALTRQVDPTSGSPPISGAAAAG
jgi:CheY-like chemotaxis protein